VDRAKACEASNRPVQRLLHVTYNAFSQNDFHRGLLGGFLGRHRQRRRGVRGDLAGRAIDQLIMAAAAC
jgi:hypothetical protein